MLGEKERVFKRSTFSDNATYRTTIFLDCVDPFDVGPISAVFVRPETIYFVEASHPKGRDLTFTWTRSASACGGFTSGTAIPTLGVDRVDGIKTATTQTPSDLHGQGAIAIWSHPSPECPHDTTVHPGTITMVVSDGENSVTRTYEKGTAAGTGTTD